MDNSPTSIVAFLIVAFFAIAIHEYAHAKVADAAGDPTPRAHGRVTLNPFAHFDPLGAVMIVITSIAGIGIGWGRPVPMDPRRMKNPKWDHFAAAAGPLSNLIQAGVYAILFRVLTMSGALPSSSFFMYLLYAGVLVNIALFLFNLIPVGRLDGMWLLGTFLPERSRWAWTRWNLSTGQFVFLALILIGQVVPEFSIIRIVVGPFRDFFVGLLLGGK